MKQALPNTIMHTYIKFSANLFEIVALVIQHQLSRSLQEMRQLHPLHPLHPLHLYTDEKLRLCTRYDSQAACCGLWLLALN